MAARAEATEILVKDGGGSIEDGTRVITFDNSSNSVVQVITYKGSHCVKTYLSYFISLYCKFLKAYNNKSFIIANTKTDDGHCSLLLTFQFLH